MKTRLTRLAEQDLRHVEEYVRTKDSLASTRLVLRILETIEGLSAFPNLGRPGRVPGTRELVMSGTPYIAVYRVRENVIWVLRVLHAARRWPPGRE